LHFAITTIHPRRANDHLIIIGDSWLSVIHGYFKSCLFLYFKNVFEKK